jgi:hypothetical protein
MNFLIACSFYSFIGCLIGFFVHIFNGLVQTKVKFDLNYIKKTIFNFIKTLIIMLATTLCITLFIGFLSKNQDEEFLHQLVFYLFAFASFDFGLKN